MTIGQRIKERRIELGYTQESLAKKVGYKSRSSINKIELSRELPLSKIELMAKALETSPGSLMGWDEEEESNPITDKNPNELCASQILETYLDKTFDPTLRRLLTYYLYIIDKVETLNDTGKKKLLERLEELEQLPDYRKES